VSSPSREPRTASPEHYNVPVHSDLAAKAEAIRWYHTIDLGGGVVTRGIDDSAFRLARLDLPASLAGLTVLDIGAWDGFFSFEAERRGAARVVASDYFSWHGAGWGSKAGFELARETFGSKVEDLDIDVMDLSPERVGQFDVVFFLGVFYHLRHPLLALERIASVTRKLLIVETVVDMVGIGRPAMAFYPGRELNNDPTNWWAPNLPALHGMLKDVGFTDVRTITPQHSAIYRAARAVSHRLRGKNSLADAYRQDRAVVHATVDNR
jgi:tRNA (mo5U34)-methyltransferase